MAAVTILSDFEAPKNKVCHCLHCFPVYLPWSNETWLSNWTELNWMGPDAMILVLCMLSFKSTFSLSSFTFIKRLFSSSSLFATLWRPSRPFRTNTQKRCPFHYRGLEWKSRKSRNTWSNRQIWPWSTEWSMAKANRVFLRERTGHNKHPLPTTQEKTLHIDITRWSILKSDWLYSLQPKMERLYTVSKNKTGSQLLLRSWTLYCQIQT